ncbi:MAG: flagellar filament capping protein FliD [Vulcanimicrobiaceae bacterium]
MSSTGSTSSSTVPGTNVPPISFPGIASGIDWNSIIQKLTSITTAPETQLNQQMATLNAANLELIKINGMLASVQSALTALSQPNMFQAFTGTSSAPNIATAQGITGVSATPGTYVIQSTQTATATQIVSDATVGHSERDNIGAGPSDSSVPLSQSYAAITPSNGSGQGKVTVNGVTVTYDVTSQSLDTILSNIQSAVQASGDGTFTIGFVGATDTVQVSDSARPISLGASGDSGNLLDVLRLSQAQVNNTSTSGTVTGTAGVGGINQATTLNASNAAGFITPVTAGAITINGVSISVDPAKDNLADVLKRINNSGAGVTASYSSSTGQITLTNNNTGPQSIVLSTPATGGSNFLSAAGLVGAGAQTTIGTQAKVALQNPSGTTTTVYSNSNNVTTAIPGIQLNLLSSNAGQPFEVTVSQDTSQLVSSLNTFVSAYNTAIGEINSATATPVVVSSQAAQLPGSSSAQSVAGGVLWNNADVNSIKDQLENMVAGLFQGANGKTISLSSIGLQLDTSYTAIVANNSSSTSSGASSSTSQPVTTQTQDGTDGLLQQLDVTRLQAALQNDPTSVQDLFSGAQGLINTIGTYLTGVTGLPTNVSSGLLGNIPTVSIIQGFENANTAQIQSIQQQIAHMQDNANQQADALRQEATSSEAQLAGYQALQQQLSGFFKQN